MCGTVGRDLESKKVGKIKALESHLTHVGVIVEKLDCWSGSQKSVSRTFQGRIRSRDWIPKRLINEVVFTLFFVLYEPVACLNIFKR